MMVGLWDAKEDFRGIKLADLLKNLISSDWVSPVYNESVLYRVKHGTRLMMEITEITGLLRFCPARDHIESVSIINCFQCSIRLH